MWLFKIMLSETFSLLTIPVIKVSPFKEMTTSNKLQFYHRFILSIISIGNISINHIILFSSLSSSAYRDDLFYRLRFHRCHPFKGSDMSLNYLYVRNDQLVGLLISYYHIQMYCFIFITQFSGIYNNKHSKDNHINNSFKSPFCTSTCT